MQVHGYTATGSISATIDGETWDIPDDMSSRFRQMIAEWEEEGNSIPPYVTPSPIQGEIDAERDRRIAAGFTFSGVFYQSRPEDRENIAGAAVAALAALGQGAQPGDYLWHGGDLDFMWIAADNTMHPFDAQSTFAMGQAAMAHKQAHIFAARALKDMDPIPGDYATNPAYWP